MATTIAVVAGVSLLGLLVTAGVLVSRRRALRRVHAVAEELCAVTTVAG
jgi:hypothetical protein